MTTAQASSTAATHASAFAGPTDDIEAVRRTVEHYNEGMRTGSVERLREGFHEQALMCGYLGDTSMVTPIQGLYDFVAGNEPPAKTGEPAAFTLTAIQISGRTATAEVVERAYMGHDFLTRFQLMKLEGRWWIVAKLFNGTPRD